MHHSSDPLLVKDTTSFRYLTDHQWAELPEMDRYIRRDRITGAGICVGLALEWVLSWEQHSTGSTDNAWARIKRFEEKSVVQEAESKERRVIFATRSANRGMLPGSHRMTPDPSPVPDRAMTTVFQKEGLQFYYYRQGTTAGELAVHMERKARDTLGFWLVDLDFPGTSGHSMALRTLRGDPMCFFDPNVGEVHEPLDGIRVFAKDLMDYYSDSRRGGRIERWAITRVSVPGLA